MEKEQKKLLLVAVSVGVFLLVTVTVAIVLLSPKAQLQDTAVLSSVPYTPTSDYTTQAPVQPVINNTQETIINIGNQDAEVIDRDNGDSLTIHIPIPSAAAVPVTPVEEVRQTTPSTVRTTPPATQVTAPAATPAATPAPAASAAQTTTPVRTTTTRTVTDFWIQTSAHSAIITAEDQRDSLASKGFVSIIDISEVSGRIMYRVWMGPYTSRSEADYWLTILKQIDGFKDDQLLPDERPYIRQTTRQI